MPGFHQAHSSLGYALRKQGKFGIKNMQDYAQSLGCELNLQTAPGQGTCVAIYVSSISLQKGV